MNILFVCTGNTCRSPMAEYLCRDLADKANIPNITVFSAGIHATNGDPITIEASQALCRVGITKVTQTANRLTKGLVDAANVIFVMEDHHRDAVEERFPEVTSKVHLLDDNGIEDPFEQSQEVYDRTLDQIKQAITEFLESVKK